MHNKAHTYLHTDGHTYPNARTRAVVHMHVNVVDVLCGLHLSYVNSFHTCAAVFNTHTVIHICAQALFYTHTLFIITLLCFERITCIHTHTQSLRYTHERVQRCLWAHTRLWYTSVCQNTHTHPSKHGGTRGHIHCGSRCGVHAHAPAQQIHHAPGS